VGNVAAGDGMRQWHDMLAPLGRMEPGGDLEKVARDTALRVARRRSYRLVARSGGFRVPPSCLWRKKTGPNPTDRAKLGSKHHILTDGQGIPLNALLTAANAHDVTQLIPLVDSLPIINGRPTSKPTLLQADRGYDSDPHRQELRKRGIGPLIARRGTAHGSNLGKTRWVVERTISWLRQFRRLRIRYEKRSDIHEALLWFGCSLICLRFC
jgi:transposase